MTPETVVEFRRRWRRALVGMALPVIPFLISESGGSWVFGMPKEGWTLLALAGLAGFFVLFWLSWRCPACGQPPSEHWRPAYCGHCGAPLLELRAKDPADPRPKSRQEWQDEERSWRRQRELIRAGELGQGLLLVVIAPFLFGILMGIGGWGFHQESEMALRYGPQAPRWAAMGFAVFFSVVGLLMLRACRRRFENLGVPPEEVRQRIAGMWVVAGALAIAIGVIALAILVTPVHRTPTGWELRLEPYDNALPLSAAFVLYTLAGVAVVVKNWRTCRGRPRS